MSQFIVVNKPLEIPCKVSELRNYYASNTIVFTENIKEIMWHDDNEEEVFISLKDGRTLCVQNTFEDIINQLKGQ